MRKVDLGQKPLHYGRNKEPRNSNTIGNLSELRPETQRLSYELLVSFVAAKVASQTKYLTKIRSIVGDYSPSFTPALGINKADLDGSWLSQLESLDADRLVNLKAVMLQKLLLKAGLDDHITLADKIRVEFV